MKRIVIVMGFFLGAQLPAHGQTVIRLTVRPARPPSPAMKFRLLPELRDFKPGNAALLYQRAHAPEWFSHFRRHPNYSQSHEWLELPLDKLPVEKVQSILPRPALQEVDLAARREFCDWEMTERVRQDGFWMLIPDVQGFREYASLLALRTRLEMRAGELEKAAYTLQTGLAMSRHIADGPTLVQGLVGTAIAGIMLGQCDDMIQLDGTPNLYWALTDLPRPFIDLRRAFQGEKIMFEAMFPGIREALKDPGREPLSAERLFDRLMQLGDVQGQLNLGNRLSIAIAAARGYPQARRFLLDNGFSRERVEAMPVIQVALMHAVAHYDDQYDNMYKWTNLPYWQARGGLLKAENDLRLSKQKTEEAGGIPLAETFMPAVQKVLEARARIDRRIAILRCVEALRLHAALHDGQLPASLSDIKEVPIPIDPVTGTDFQYKLGKGKAILVGPAPPGEAANTANSIRYELTLKTAKNE